MSHAPVARTVANEANEGDYPPPPVAAIKAGMSPERKGARGPQATGDYSELRAGSVTPKAAGDLCELRGAAQRARGLRGKGAHCLASLTHVFKLMPLLSGKGKSSHFDAMPQLFVKSHKKTALARPEVFSCFPKDLSIWMRPCPAR